ncbi:ribose-phosphate diphosphokinase [Pajaroellobacter abortibovis]|uniref:Ribose-phosphate pyrophosphokinase n=1 Tax=Pajaroellobacter abortibovis TaxID=1882918 RepID=A0A1L6MXK5_9BACT|nr:ribose-phosphate pyrophosphokinase [Pajaroellobacter abortibovis]APS00313.1 phosphoribosylpyrophosphate synthetase [Pajaroellobacter abortibovis]
MKKISLFAGQANQPLAEAIARYLQMSLSPLRIHRFSDGEYFCEIGENVRGVDAYIIQPTCSPVNDHIMEFLIIADALRRASAGSITAVIPYYGYARQDRKVAPRTPITSKLIADLIQTAGVSRVVSMDLHAGQIQGFFNIPFDHLYAMPAFLQDYLYQKFDSTAVFVSPDAGGVERARAYSKRLNAQLAIIDKRRERANVSEVVHLIGDVQGRTCVIVDDMIDTAGTLCNAAQALVDHGATSVVVVATHGVLSGPAIERIDCSPLDEVVVTNTIPLSSSAQACKKMKQVDIAPLLGEAIKRIHQFDSVSSLFE